MEITSFDIQLLKYQFMTQNYFWSFIGILPPKKIPYIIIKIEINKNLVFNVRLHKMTWNMFKKKVKKNRNITCKNHNGNMFKLIFGEQFICIYTYNNGNFTYLKYENNNIVKETIDNL